MSKKKQGETTALANRQPTEVANPADFKSLGDTTIGAQDIQMPRLKLLQALSQAVTDGDAPSGVFFNSLTSENYGPAVVIVPVIGFKNRVYMEQGKGLLCRSLDMVHGVGSPGGSCDACPLKDWPEDRSDGGPKCRESRNWVALIVGATGEGPFKKGENPDVKPLDEPQFIVVQMMSMASAAAKKLNGLFLNSRVMNPQAQWYDYQFKLTSNQTKNDKGTFFIPDVRPAGKTSAELIASAKSLMNFIAGKTITTDVDPDDMPDVATATTPDGTPSF